MPLRGLKAGRMFRHRSAPRTTAVLFSVVFTIVSLLFPLGLKKRGNPLERKELV